MHDDDKDWQERAAVRTLAARSGDTAPAGPMAALSHTCVKRPGSVVRSGQLRLLLLFLLHPFGTNRCASTPRVTPTIVSGAADRTEVNNSHTHV